MSVSKRFWEGTLTKNGSEIGFAEGTLTVDMGVQLFHELGTYDIVGRRGTARVIDATIDHGYIDESSFYFYVTGAGDQTFQIAASFSNHALTMSGCMITDYDFELPSDGWINESISISVKSLD